MGSLKLDYARGNESSSTNNDVLYLDNKLIRGCIYLDELPNKKLTSIFLGLSLSLIIALTYYVLSQISIIKSPISILLIALTFIAFLATLYLLWLVLTLVKNVNTGLFKQERTVICDSEREYEYFSLILDEIREGKLDPAAIWLAQGKIGALKIFLITLLTLISGLIIIINIINGAYMNPLLYMMAIIFIVSVKYLKEFIFSCLQLRYLTLKQK